MNSCAFHIQEQKHHVIGTCKHVWEAFIQWHCRREFSSNYALQLQITKTIYFRYVRHQMHLFMLCAI